MDRGQFHFADRIPFQRGPQIGRIAGQGVRRECFHRVAADIRVFIQNGLEQRLPYPGALRILRGKRANGGAAQNVIVMAAKGQDRGYGVGLLGCGVGNVGDRGSPL